MRRRCSFRLFARAPRMTSSPFAAAAARAAARSPLAAQVRAGQRPVPVASSAGRALEDHLAAVLAGARTRGRRRSRPSGSSPRRARRRPRCCRDRAGAASVASSFRLSRWCRPIDGSSSTYSTPVRFEPICVARRMRCPSPPDSVAALRREREVADADVVQEAQPVADLAQDAAGDERLALASARSRRTRSSASLIGRFT
jgi:hypothetical protein